MKTRLAAGQAAASRKTGAKTKSNAATASNEVTKHYQPFREGKAWRFHHHAGLSPCYPTRQKAQAEADTLLHIIGESIGAIAITMREAAANRHEATVTTTIPDAMQKRLDATVKGAGASEADILRAGAMRIVEEWEAEGAVRFGPNQLRISHKHADAFKKWADFLEVEPQTFVSWHHDDAAADLEDPMGILSTWVHEILDYKGDKASERRVKERMRKLDIERHGHPMKHDRPKPKAGRKAVPR